MTNIKVLKQTGIDKISIYIIMLIMFINVLHIEYWKKDYQIFAWDMLEYYTYLPSAFIYHDITIQYGNDPESKNLVKGGLKLVPLPNGNNALRMSSGMAIMNLPWFWVGHLIALNSDYPANGFTAPYKFAIEMGALVYILIGLLFMRKTLRLFFNKKVTAAVLLGIGLGTNFYFYSVFEPAMSHAYGFVLFSIMFWYLIQWHQHPNRKNTILLGAIFGFVVLIRPSNMVAILMIGLWNVYSWESAGTKIMFFIKQYKMVLLMMLAFFIMWTPQFIYWKYVVGQWIFFSYPGESFYFLNPHIIDSLFSFRKGWFIYTPIMALSILGIIWLRRYHLKQMSVAITVYLVFNIWILSSWWCWWWGGSLGNRAMIESYAFLAFPLGAFVQYAYTHKKKLVKVSLLSLFLLFGVYGIFQNQKYYHHSIHYDSMNKNVFFYNFWNLKPKPDFWNRLTPPDYQSAVKGEEEKPIPKQK